MHKLVPRTRLPNTKHQHAARGLHAAPNRTKNAPRLSAYGPPAARRVGPSRVASETRDGDRRHVALSPSDRRATSRPRQEESRTCHAPCDAHLPYIVPHNTQREHQPGVAGPTGIDCRYALPRPAHDDAQACSWRRSLMTSHHARDEAAAHGVSEAWTNMFHSSSSARSQPCVAPFGALFGPPPRDLNLLELFWDRLEAQLEALQSGSIFGAP